MIEEDKEENHSFTEWVFIVIIVTISLYGYYYYLGWVIHYLWLWYIVPLGVIEVTVYQGIGIALLFSVIKGSNFIKKDVSKKTISNFFLSPIIALGIGYCFKFVF